MNSRDIALTLECDVIGTVERLKKGEMTIEQTEMAIECHKRMIDLYFAAPRGSIFNRLRLHIIERRLLKETADFDQLANELLES